MTNEVDYSYSNGKVGRYAKDTAEQIMHARSVQGPDAKMGRPCGHCRAMISTNCCRQLILSRTRLALYATDSGALLLRSSHLDPQDYPHRPWVAQIGHQIPLPHGRHRFPDPLPNRSLPYRRMKPVRFHVEHVHPRKTHGRACRRC